MKKGQERLDAENWKVHQKKTEKRVIPNIPRFTDIIKLHSFPFHNAYVLRVRTRIGTLQKLTYRCIKDFS